MSRNSEQLVLQGICEGSKRALQDIHMVLGKVYDDELALDLNLQAAKYSGLEEKAAIKLGENGGMFTDLSILGKTKRWAYLQANTAFNVSTGHIADMMLQGTKERSQGVKKMIEENPIMRNMVMELAEEFLDFESNAMRILETYL